MDVVLFSPSGREDRYLLWLSCRVIDAMASCRREIEAIGREAVWKMNMSTKAGRVAWFSEMKLVVAYLEALQEYLSTISRCWDSVVGILNSLMLSLCLDKLSPQERRPTRRLYTSPSHVIRINAKDLGSHHRQLLAKPAYLGSAGDKPRSFDNDQATRQIRRHIGALPRPPPPPQPRLTCIEFQKGRAKPDGCNVPAPAVSQS